MDAVGEDLFVISSADALFDLTYVDINSFTFHFGGVSTIVGPLMPVPTGPPVALSAAFDKLTRHASAKTIGLVLRRPDVLVSLRLTDSDGNLTDFCAYINREAGAQNIVVICPLAEDSVRLRLFESGSQFLEWITSFFPEFSHPPASDVIAGKLALEELLLALNAIDGVRHGKLQATYEKFVEAARYSIENSDCRTILGSFVRTVPLLHECLLNPKLEHLDGLVARKIIARKHTVDQQDIVELADGAQALARDLNLEKLQYLGLTSEVLVDDRRVALRRLFLAASASGLHVVEVRPTSAGWFADHDVLQKVQSSKRLLGFFQESFDPSTPLPIVPPKPSLSGTSVECAQCHYDNSLDNNGFCAGCGNRLLQTDSSSTQSVSTAANSAENSCNFAVNSLASALPFRTPAVDRNCTRAAGVDDRKASNFSSAYSTLLDQLQN